MASTARASPTRRWPRSGRSPSPGDNQADNPDVWARLAEIQFTRGDWEGADASYRRALKVKPDHLPARWVEARLLEAKGEREKAELAFKWFVDYQVDNNQALAKDPQGLLIVGQGAEKVHPRQVPRRGAERGAEQGHQ